MGDVRADKRETSAMRAHHGEALRLTFKMAEHRAPPAIPTLNSQRSAKLFEAIQTVLDDIHAGCIAESDGLIVSKREAWHHRDIRLAQQPIGEVLGSQGQPADVGKNVKSAQRFDGGNVLNFCQPAVHVLAADIKFLPHINHRLLIAFQSGESALLSE